MQLFISSLFLFFALGTPSESPDLFEQSKQEAKPVLLYFSGSDWCHNCIRLNENIVSKASFKAQILDNTVYYEADFPQKKKLEKDVTRFNEFLCETYNPQGIFPQLVLVNSQKEVLVQTTYHGNDLNFYIDLFKPYLSE